MIGLVMAGGRGTRMLRLGEKLALGKRPMVLRVIDAVAGSGLCERIITTTSKNSPQARAIIKNDSRADVIETGGAGYVEDLTGVLRGLDGDVLIVPGDLALLDGEVLRNALAARTDNDAWTVIMSTVKFAESFGARPDYSVDVGGTLCAYTGVSIVNAAHVCNAEPVGEDKKIMDDRRIVLNVNTPADYKLSLESLTEP